MFSKLRTQKKSHWSVFANQSQEMKVAKLVLVAFSPALWDWIHAMDGVWEEAHPIQLLMDSHFCVSHSESSHLPWVVIPWTPDPGRSQAVCMPVHWFESIQLLNQPSLPIYPVPDDDMTKWNTNALPSPFYHPGSVTFSGCLDPRPDMGYPGKADGHREGRANGQRSGEWGGNGNLTALGPGGAGYQ